MGRLFLAAFVAVMLIGTAFLAWLGAFSSVVIEEMPIGPFVFVYRDLPEATPADVGRVTSELIAELAAAGVTGVKPLGVYAPDGSAQIGVAVGEGADKVAGLPDVRARSLVAERGLVARFPWRMPLSFVVSYLRVNPAFERYREAKGFAVAPAWVLLEGDEIVNMMPIAEH